MSNKITQIIPSIDWHYVTKDEGNNVFATRVAAWGLLESGDVVALIPSEQNASNNEPPYPRLVPVPSGKGKYMLEGNVPSHAKFV